MDSTMAINGMTSGGINAVEGRIRAIEGRINSLEKMTGESAQSFGNYLQTIPQQAGALTSSMAQRAQALKPAIEEIAGRYGVDHDLVNAVIKQESGYNPNAVSKAGATGLMQLMPATAKTLGVSDATNPLQNIEGGVRHLRDLLTHYRGNIPLALAAYNAGSGAVDKYGGVPPYAETQNYVRSILAQYLRAKNNV